MLEDWKQNLPDLRARYNSGVPYPNIQIKNFFKPAVAKKLLEEFPEPKHPIWTTYYHYNQNKLTTTNHAKFPPTIASAIEFLQTDEFAKLLSEITGIEGLVSDASLEGGRIHQSERGGFLNIHVDHVAHNYEPDWRRRLNLLIYLNDAWDESWGGNLELWDRQMKSCVTKYAPLFNHAVIFATDESTYHGHPEPLMCPEGVTRKSISVYYYTKDLTLKHAPSHYVSRPQDSLKVQFLIWLDNLLLCAYAWLRKQFKFNDSLIGKLLSKLQSFGKNKK